MLATARDAVRLPPSAGPARPTRSVRVRSWGRRRLEAARWRWLRSTQNSKKIFFALRDHRKTNRSIRQVLTQKDRKRHCQTDKFRQPQRPSTDYTDSINRLCNLWMAF